MDFFFYGSLRDIGVLNAVIGRPPASGLASYLTSEKGWLKGFRANRIEGEN